MTLKGEKTESPQDYELLNRIATGDTAAVDVFIAKWRPSIVKFARTLSKDFDPDDIAQETLMNFYRNRIHIASSCKSSITALLFTIARNAVYNAHRYRSSGKRNAPTVSIDAPIRNKNDKDQPIEIADQSALPESSVYAAEIIAKVSIAIRQNWQAQAVLNLVIIQGMTATDAAKQMGVAKSQITHLMKKIGRIVERLDGHITRQQRAYAFIQHIDEKLHSVSLAGIARVTSDSDHLRSVIIDYDEAIAKGKV